jgi:hypothetical protein
MKNKSAFPLHDAGHGSPFDEGMTLRDYFASRAMQAELTVYEGTNWPRVAKQAYQMADAMMKAREE